MKRWVPSRVLSRVASTCSAPHSPLRASNLAVRTCTSAAPSRLPANHTAIKSPPGRAVTEEACTKSVSCEDTKRLVYCGAVATLEAVGLAWANGASTCGGWLCQAAKNTASRLQISKAERIENLLGKRITAHAHPA